MKQEIRSEISKLKASIRSSILSLKDHVFSEDQLLSKEAKEVTKYAEQFIFHLKRFK